MSFLGGPFIPPFQTYYHRTARFAYRLITVYVYAYLRTPAVSEIQLRGSIWLAPMGFKIAAASILLSNSTSFHDIFKATTPGTRQRESCID